MTFLTVMCTVMACIFVGAGVKAALMRRPGVSLTAFVIAAVFVVLSWWAFAS